MLDRPQASQLHSILIHPRTSVFLWIKTVPLDGSKIARRFSLTEGVRGCKIPV